MWKYLAKDQGTICVTHASQELTLFGCRIRLVITAYTNNTPGDRWTAINFVSEGVNRSRLRLNHRTENGFKTIEQFLDAPVIYGGLLDHSTLDDDHDVAVGRTVADAFLRRMAGVVEENRATLRRCFGKEVRAHGVDHIARYMGDVSEFDKALRELHYALLLRHSGIPESAIQAIETIMRNNRFERYPFDHDGVVAIPPLSAESFVFSKETVANMKATALLRHVCGDELYREFRLTEQITVHSRGYKFVISPRAHVHVTDEGTGGCADFCIHTSGFSCNPIDEVVLAYLSIQHEFERYFKTANIFRRSGNFRLPWDLDKVQENAVEYA